MCKSKFTAFAATFSHKGDKEPKIRGVTKQFSRVQNLCNTCKFKNYLFLCQGIFYYFACLAVGLYQILQQIEMFFFFLQ